MGHSLLPEPGSILARAADFLDIREILKATGGLLGADEVGFAEVVDGEIVFHGDDFVFPRGMEFETGDRGEEVDFARRNSKTELSSRSGEVVLGDTVQWNSENKECPHQLAGVFGRRLQPNVEILGIAGLGMVDHRISTGDEVADLTLG